MGSGPCLIVEVPEMETGICRMCGLSEPAHASLNHEFSTDGQLRQKDPQVPTKPPVRVRVMPDLVLRAALLEKGIITGQDLNNAEVKLRGEHPGPSIVDSADGRDSSGDRQDRAS